MNYSENMGEDIIMHNVCAPVHKGEGGGGGIFLIKWIYIVLVIGILYWFMLLETSYFLLLRNVFSFDFKICWWHSAFNLFLLSFFFFSKKVTMSLYYVFVTAYGSLSEKNE